MKPSSVGLKCLGFGAISNLQYCAVGFLLDYIMASSMQKCLDASLVSFRFDIGVFRFITEDFQMLNANMWRSV
jgi:hypothetical protein